MQYFLRSSSCDVVPCLACRRSKFWNWTLGAGLMDNEFSDIFSKVSAHRRGPSLKNFSFLMWKVYTASWNWDFVCFCFCLFFLPLCFLLETHTDSLSLILSPVYPNPLLVFSPLVPPSPCSFLPLPHTTSNSTYPPHFLVLTVLLHTCHQLSLIPKCCFPLSTLPVSFPLPSPWCSDGHHGNWLQMEGGSQDCTGCVCVCGGGMEVEGPLFKGFGSPCIMRQRTTDCHLCHTQNMHLVHANMQKYILMLEYICLQIPVLYHPFTHAHPHMHLTGRRCQLQKH